jgi:RNA polymerase sigma factor (sigma-70 family)
MSDGQLLEQFARRRSESAETAFAALVDRHGAMVFRVCRGIVGNDDDAQDAFQATFFILAQKGASLWVRDSIAPWLHQVARRAAGRLKTVVNRQRAIERKAASFVDTPCDLNPHDEWAETLHEEIARLPRCFRLPIVLCDLEGHSYEAAAKYLNCPPGTIKSRLARGRNRLRDGLARRALTPAGGPCESPVPAVFVSSTISARLAKATVHGVIRATPHAAQSAGPFSVSVTTLAERVLQVMLLTRIKTVVVAALAAGIVITGLGLLAKVTSGQSQPLTQVPDGTAAITKTEASSPLEKEESTVETPDGQTVKSKTGPFDTQEPVITLGDSKRIWAYDPGRKKWHTYTAPEGLRITPRFSNSRRLVAVMIEGQPINEVAVFSTKVGKWSRQALAEPATFAMIDAFLQDDYAAYVIDRHVYAFSAVTGKWSQQTLERKRKPPNINFSFHSLLMLQDEQSIHAYSAITGTWQTLKAEGRNPDNPRVGPGGTALVVNGGRLYSFDPQVGRFEEVKADEE